MFDLSPQWTKIPLYYGETNGKYDARAQSMLANNNTALINDCVHTFN